MKVLSAAQTKELENHSAEQGLRHFQLMENAGTAAFFHLYSDYSDKVKNKRIMVLCGKGNNGGDGFVIARKLAEMSCKVIVVLVMGFPETPDARTMFERLEGNPYLTFCSWDMENEKTQILDYVSHTELFLDCVYGIGFHGTLPLEVKELFHAVNGTVAERIAVDIPSGSVCDTGEVSTNCFKAHKTLTFSSYKPVHWLREGANVCGKVTVLSIGIDKMVMERQACLFEVLNFEEIASLFPRRKAESNKGSYGTAVCLCGSYGMAGAAMLAARGALRCGAGLVHMIVPAAIYPIIAANVIEPVYMPLNGKKEDSLFEENSEKIFCGLEKATAILIGCGWGKSEDGFALLQKILAWARVPVVIDADGINLVAQHINILKTATAPVILTPHPGEMARLMRTTVADIQAHRMEYAHRFVQEYQVGLVLKGNQTVIAFPDGRCFLNPTGNPGMAKGGSGDLLAGMIVSLLAQGKPMEAAVPEAVFLHGMAGDRCAARLSQTAMLPSDMLEDLCELFLEIEGQD